MTDQYLGQPSEPPAGETPVPSDLEFALALADIADGISLDRFGADDLQVQSKPDLTPVSDADLAVERALRTAIAQQRPDDEVLGEEFGSVGAGGRRQWILDPIDGTKSFVRGVPIWATLIGLLVDDRPALGVVSAPALARRWWARVEGGAFGSFAGGPARRLRVSGVRDLADASLGYSSVPDWSGTGRRQQFELLLERCWRTRGYGDFYSYMLVAEGAVDVATEPELSLWDLAALVPIVTEAGGTFTDLDGVAFGPATGSALATNGLLHQQVLGLLQG